jgi:hypothetical protein
VILWTRQRNEAVQITEPGETGTLLDELSGTRGTPVRGRPERGTCRAGRSLRAFHASDRVFDDQMQAASITACYADVRRISRMASSAFALCGRATRLPLATRPSHPRIHASPARPKMIAAAHA